MSSEKLIKVAVIAGAHGIKGEVKLHVFVENPDFFEPTSSLLDSAGKKQFSIKITGKVKNAIIAKIDGVSDRNAAELLKGTELFTSASALPTPDDGEFYHSQLIGLEARLSSNEKIGTVTAIHNYGAGDIVEIAMNSGGVDMLPLAKPWVGEINIVEGFIVVELAEYL
jgi:16S rRNA processing protein RimM